MLAQLPVISVLKTQLWGPGLHQFLRGGNVLLMTNTEALITDHTDS